MTAPPVLLDLSDLFFQIGRGPLTGIARVGHAYLEACLARPGEVLGLIHHRRGVLLLDRAAMRWLAEQVSDGRDWPRPGLRSCLRTDMPVAQRGALTALRARASAEALPFRMRALLRRRVSSGSAAILTGMSNIHRRQLSAFRAAGLRPVVLIHDTIPLDFPEFVPKGGHAWFETRFRAVGKLASLVLYNSRHTRDAAARHFARLGRVPQGLVAHLGVTRLTPDPDALPPAIDPARPLFVVLGTIEPRKNHAFLLDLWEGLAQERCEPMPQLAIVGSRGWRNDAVLRRLDNSPLMGRDVHELADLPDGVIAALMARADALLFPSHAEGFGLPAIEAASLGTPVICNDLPVYSEFLGDYPLRLPVSDADAWRRAILAHCRGRPHRPAPPPLPTWHEHFDQVWSALARLDRLDDLR